MSTIPIVELLYSVHNQENMNGDWLETKGQTGGSANNPKLLTEKNEL